MFAASSDYSDPAKRPKLVVTYQPMKKYFYLKDHLGNIRVTVDENGDVKGYNDYYPFGLRMPGRSMNNALATDMYKYSSKELDEENGINWYYFGARYYDPMIGRWWSVDPLADKYISLSPYNYVENNPINLFDPDGKGWERDFNNFVSPNQTKHAAMHNSAIMLANERYYFNKYGPTVLDGMSVFFLLTGPAGAPFSAGTSFLSFFWSASLENHTTDTMVSLSTSVLGGMTKNPKIQLTLATLQIIYDLFLSGEDNFTNNTNMFTPDKTNVAHSLQHELMKDLGWLTKPSPQEMWDDINKDTENNNTTEEEDNNTD